MRTRNNKKKQPPENTFIENVVLLAVTSPNPQERATEKRMQIINRDLGAQKLMICAIEQIMK